MVIISDDYVYVNWYLADYIVCPPFESGETEHRQDRLLVLPDRNNGRHRVEADTHQDQVLACSHRCRRWVVGILFEKVSWYLLSIL